MGGRRSTVSGASEDRLERLIAARLAHGTVRKSIEQRIWDLFGAAKAYAVAYPL